MESKIIKISKGRETIVDADDYEYLNQFKWYVNSKGYAVRTTRNAERGVGLPKVAIMSRVIMKTTNNRVHVDHINGNRLDNRKENLREVNQRQNSWNTQRTNMANNWRGVYYSKKDNKFCANIVLPGETTLSLGQYDSPAIAAVAYDTMALFLRGDFAHLNFPDARVVELQRMARTFAEAQKIIEILVSEKKDPDIFNRAKLFLEKVGEK